MAQTCPKCGLATLLLIVLCACQPQPSPQFSAPPEASKSSDPVSQEDAYSKYRIAISQMQIEKGRARGTPRIVGKVRNYSRRPYLEIHMLVHVYDKEGARILQQEVTAENILPGETVRIDKPLSPEMGEMMSVNLEAAAKCEVKAVIIR